MSLEGISSKGSLRFDEFPTSMKATQSFSGSRATRLLAYENARPSESRCSPFLRDEHARTPPPAFPFLRITMSKSRSDPKAMPRARTPDGSKSPIRSQRQPQSPETNSGLDPLLSEGSRGRVWSRRKWERPARRGHLSAAHSLVKGPVTVSSPYFSGRL